MRCARTMVSTVAVCLAVLLGAAPVDAEPSLAQGFGAGTPGGAGKPVVRVTNLNDSGPGSLREALKGGNRMIVFDVAGEIVLSQYLFVTGAFVTVDGFSAPSPGITLRNRGLAIRGSRGAHDVIVRGLRVRDAVLDGLQVAAGAYNVLFDHVSVDNSGDGNLDITEGAHDVTVAWSVLSGNVKNMLIKYGASRVTLHHNVFVENGSRNPQVRMDDNPVQATETTLDMRNNVVASWIGYGTLIWDGPWANVVNNYYSVSDDAIQVIAARAYVAGNVSGDRADLNRVGTEQVPFPAPFVDTTDACAAAADVLQRAGTRPLDDLDRLSLARVPVNGCAAGSTPTPDVTGPSDPAAVTGVWAVAAAADDGLETVSGSVKVVSVVIPVGRASLTAFRFAGIDIPRGAVIQSAVLYLFTLGNDGKAIHVRYRGERSADSAPLSLAAGDLSSRSKTTAFIDGSPPPWPLREFSASPDLSTVIHEIVAQPGWQPGNSLTLFVADNGSAASRSVGAFESRPSPTRAAQLVVTYR